MRRFWMVGFGLMLCLLSGCSTQPSSDVYYVMFDGHPKLFLDGVYFRGMSIGEIVDSEAGENGVHTLTIRIPNDSKELMTDNAVFYISSGRLEYTTLANFGEALPFESKILGLHSKLGLAGFRFKNVFNPLPAAAAAEAERLYNIRG